jgi:hypothetical protein
MQQVNAGYLLAAYAVQYVGLILERSFFITQGYHAQNLHCQTA